MAIPSRIDRRRLAAITVFLALALPQALVAQYVRGHVEDESTGERVVGAEVRLLFDGAVAADAISDSAGEFRVSAERSGDHVLSVNGFGFAGVDHELRLQPREEITVRVRLAPRALALEPVTVVARRRAPAWLGDFHQRAEFNRKAGHGRIYLREDLERMGARPVRHILLATPTRNCDMSVLLDGLPTDPRYLNESVTTDDLEGLEIYRHSAHIPVRYYRPGMCGAILAWSRAPDGARPWSLTRALIGGGILLGMLLLR